MESQTCTLNWPTHSSEFFQTLGELRKETKYSDATIACNGEFFAVHKFALSTASNYFEEIFSRIDSHSPMIIIKDISAKDMRYLLDFMYLGRVDITTSEMGSFARAAECLKIKGFTSTNAQIRLPHIRKSDKEICREPKLVKTIHIVSPSKIQKPQERPLINPNSSLLHIGTREGPSSSSLSIKKTMPPSVIRVTSGSLTRPNVSWADTQEAQNLVASTTISSQPQLSEDLSGTWTEVNATDIEMEQDSNTDKKDSAVLSLVTEPKHETDICCDLCGRTFKRRKYLSLHMKTHTGEKPHECDICGFRSVQSGVLSRHLRKHTGEKPFVCQFCNYKSSQKGALQRHTKLKHFSIGVVHGSI